MRTKTCLLAAAILTAGLSASVAQTVYSVNAVGYVNLNLVANFNLIANPLKGTNNNLSTILPTVPDGAQLLTWNAAAQRFNDASIFFGAEFGWVPGGTLEPGIGAFLFLPTPATITFVGEVPQGPALVNPVPANFGLLSSIVPQEISLSAASFPFADGDQVLFWDPALQRFKDATIYFGAEFGWVPTNPTPKVGEGFFYFNTGAARSWTRSFSVN